MYSERWMQYLKATLDEGKLEVHEPNYEIITVFTEYLPPKKYPKILDVGAGAGIDMKVLRETGYSVTGIGFGEKNINHAHAHGTEILEMDMHELRFPDKSFDGVFSIQTFEHSLSPFIVTSEISRVLKNKGRALIDTPDPNDEAMWSLNHPSLLFPIQLKRLFSLVGLETIVDLSKKHRTQVIFEKQGSD